MKLAGTITQHQPNNAVITTRQRKVKSAYVLWLVKILSFVTLQKNI
jgi:hypothetical protein